MVIASIFLTILYIFDKGFREFINVVLIIFFGILLYLSPLIIFITLIGLLT